MLTCVFPGQDRETNPWAGAEDEYFFTCSRVVPKVPFAAGRRFGGTSTLGRRRGTDGLAGPTGNHPLPTAMRAAGKTGQEPGTRSRTTHVSRAVHVRQPVSLVMTISEVMVLRPTCRGVATPVTVPDMAAR